MMRGADLKAKHFLWELRQGVGIIRLNRPQLKNPLTFDSYRELGETFRRLDGAQDVGAIVFASREGNFCSGGDVREIIGPLLEREMEGLLEFTRMTGELVRAMLECRRPIVAAVDGVCVGAGAMIALASDLRLATPRARTAFLFARVGLSGCDMGACTLLPRVLGQTRAAELLYTGRTMSAEEGAAWGFYNRVVPVEELEEAALELAARLARGPRFAHAMTKTMLVKEWSMSLPEAIEAEAQAQAICMKTPDFRRAYQAFLKKEKPRFGED